MKINSRSFYRTLHCLMHALPRMKNIGQSLVVLPSGDALPPITVSIGVSEARADDTLAGLFDRASNALQLARDNGGNCVKAVQ